MISRGFADWAARERSSVGRLCSSLRAGMMTLTVWRQGRRAEHTATPKAAQQEEARRPQRQRDEQQDQHRSHATTFLATFWPQRTTIGMPPPGFTEPPTKKRFGYFVLCFGALKARFLKRSLTTP